MNIGKFPKELVNQVKELGGEIVKPASKEGIRKVALGAGVGGAVSPVYSAGFDYLWSKLPFQNNLARTLVKIGIPIGISVFALKTKVPGGNLIAGIPLGVSISEGVKAFINFIKGRPTGLSLATSTTAEDTTTVDGDLELYGVFD